MDRAVVELAKDWRLDKYLRQLQAFLIVANAERAYLLSGTGDLIQPDDGILAIGSGGPYALAAARGPMQPTQMTAPPNPSGTAPLPSTAFHFTHHKHPVGKPLSTGIQLSAPP